MKFLNLDGLVYLWEKLKSRFVQQETGKGLSSNDYTTIEKNKLSGVAIGATKVEAGSSNGSIIIINDANTQVYVHPTSPEASAAFVKIGRDANGHVVTGDLITKNDITGLGIPAQDTTYQPVTTSLDGLMASSDKTKLNGIESNAQVNVLENIKVNGTAKLLT